MAIWKRNSRILLLAAFTISLMLSACSKPTATPVPTNTPAPTQSSILPTSAPTQTLQPTPTLLPTPAQVANNLPVGVIVFTMGDGAYRHLYAYQPNYLTISRLTSGNWDDIDPAISPDGNSMVFASNRSGQWDIYLWQLAANTLRQITNTPEFENGLNWSPDNQWITYSVESGNESNIFIQSTTDASSAPFQLTENMGNNLSPAWSPLGRQVVFSSDRNGSYEIWLADLDRSDNRFELIASGDDADYLAPAWSPDGQALAWEKLQGDLSTIESAQLSNLAGGATAIGTGKLPFWSVDGNTILARFDDPNQYYLTGYTAQSGQLAYPLIALPAKATHFQWAAGNSFENISALLAASTTSPRGAYCQPVQTLDPNGTGRFSLVALGSVKVSNAYLSDTSDECFSALRQVVGARLGWDFLGILKSAALPVTTAADPGIPQNWLYSGRAIALNLAPLDAGWMAVSREDFEGQTYWRVWVKCLKQDGSCGETVHTPTWDFPARASGDLAAFEAGGKTAAAPGGYWLDFTDIALQYGWQRLPAQSNWRTYYPGILFNTFAFTQGKSWEQAMLELYPPDVIQLLEAGK